jgi:hypothetical protein
MGSLFSQVFFLNALDWGDAFIAPVRLLGLFWPIIVAAYVASLVILPKDYDKI